jgi:hypothetical protein
MVPLLEIAARLKSIPPQGWPQNAPIMGCCWNGGGNVGQAKELEAELERLPKCDNDERWGFIRAKLAV